MLRKAPPDALLESLTFDVYIKEVLYFRLATSKCDVSGIIIFFFLPLLSNPIGSTINNRKESWEHCI